MPRNVADTLAAAPANRDLQTAPSVCCNSIHDRDQSCPNIQSAGIDWRFTYYKNRELLPGIHARSKRYGRGKPDKVTIMTILTYVT